MCRKFSDWSSDRRRRLSAAIENVTPQPPPTSQRIKDLLSIGLMDPERLTADEIREMTASVVYHLLARSAH